MTARLISSFTLDSTNNTLRFVQDPNGTPSNQDLVVTTGGTRWHSDDADASSDILDDLVQEASNELSLTLTVDIQGIGAAEADTAEGRIKITMAADADDWEIDWSASTLDPRIFGFRSTSSNSFFAAAGGSVVSPDVHRYGWYPQREADEDHGQLKGRNFTELSTGGYPDGVDWPEFTAQPLSFGYVPSPLVRVAAAADSTRNPTDYDLTLGDLNCAWERFCRDVCADSDKRVRYYPDVSDVATFTGGLLFPPGPIYSDPLAAPTRIAFKEGEIWAVVTQLVSEP